MRTRVMFQYVAPGTTKPDDLTLPDVLSELEAGDAAPNIGDLVTMQPSSPDGQIMPFETYKVVARHFLYTQEGGGSSLLIDCQIFVMVTDAAEDEIGYTIAE